jgi:hypothetical protein
MFVDGAPAKLKIHFHVVGYRGTGSQCLYVLGVGVNLASELVHVSPVPQRLDAARGRTRPDGDEELALCPHLANAFRIVYCGHRALHQSDVVWTLELLRSGFEEIRNLDAFRDRQQFVLGIE